MKLEGKLVRLRPLQISDEERIAILANEEEIGRFTTVPIPYTREHARNFIAANLDNDRHTGFDYAIATPEDNLLVGAIALRIKEGVRAEIGYWLGKDYRGKGYVKDAVLTALDYGFNRRELLRVFAAVYTPNIPSTELLRSVGFKDEGIMRKYARKNGVVHDAFLLGMTDPRYRELYGNKK